jgi:hypothetical protein
MDIHDARDAAGAPADFSVTWNVEIGSGKMTRNAAGSCWDVIGNGQVDIPCPAGDWPAP